MRDFAEDPLVLEKFKEVARRRSGEASSQGMYFITQTS